MTQVLDQRSFQGYLPQSAGGQQGTQDQNWQQMQQYANQQQTLQAIEQQRQQDAYYAQLQSQTQNSSVMSQQDSYGQAYQTAYGQNMQAPTQQQQFPGSERYDGYRDHLTPQGILPTSKKLPQIDTRQPWESQGEVSAPSSYSMQGFEIPKGQSDIDFQRIDPKEFKKFILYYKPSCRFCQNLKAVAATHTDLDEKILKINIDNYEVSGLRGVPTIVDQGYQYLGNQALLWLKEKGVTELRGVDIDESDESGYCALDDDLLASESGGFCLFEQATNKTVDFQTLDSMDSTGRGMGSSALESQMDTLRQQRTQVQVPRGQASHVFYR